MSEQPIRDLGQGLILRRATLADADPLVAFNRMVHGEGAWDEKGLEACTSSSVTGQ